MPNIVIITETCKHCNACVEECPASVFAAEKKGVAPRVDRADHCIACGHCVALCKSGAIQHSEFPPGTVHPINRGQLPNSEGLMELLRARRSARVFQNKPVPRELLEKIIEAARLAPTAHNYQGTGYVVVQDDAQLREIVKRTAFFLGKSARLLRNPVIRSLYGLVASKEVKGAVNMLDSLESVANAGKEGIDLILRDAPCVLLFHADSALAYPDKSAQLAVQNATLMCETLGLMSFYTGFVVSACDNGVKFSVLSRMPKNHHVYAGLAIGYSKFTFNQWADRKPAQVEWR